MIQLAWRNIWRHKQRTWLTISGISLTTFICVFLLSLQLGTYNTMKQNALSLFSGFAQLQTAKYHEEPELKHHVKLSTEVIASLNNLPDLHWSGRLASYGLLSVNSQSVAAQLVGVDVQRESKVSRLAASIKQGTFLTDNQQAQIILGKTLAKNLNVTINQPVTMISTDDDGVMVAEVFTVVGIMATGEAQIDQGLALMPLKFMQQLFNLPQQVNYLVLTSPDLTQYMQQLEPILQTKVQQQTSLTYYSWQALMPGFYQAIKLDFSTGILWYLTMVVVVVMLLFNSLLMSILERQKELGILECLGMKPNHVASLVLLELLLLLLLAIAIGELTAMSLVQWFNYHGLQLPGTENIFSVWGLPNSIYPKLSWLSILLAPAMLVAMSLFFAIYLFIKVRAIEPLTAVRSQS